MGDGSLDESTDGIFVTENGDYGIILVQEG